MIKITTVAAIAALAAAPAFAGGHANGGNSEAAKGMAAALKSGGGGNNSPLKEALGLEGNGGVASFVSGKGTGGWGNVGSALLPTGQVSKRNK
jgi:hypothetical protein